MNPETQQKIIEYVRKSQQEHFNAGYACGISDMENTVLDAVRPSKRMR